VYLYNAKNQNSQCAVIPKSQIPLRYLVADRSEAGRSPAASWNLVYHYELAGLRQVCDQPRTCLRPG